jgi:hypothetical protein
MLHIERRRSLAVFSVEPAFFKGLCAERRRSPFAFALRSAFAKG